MQQKWLLKYQNFVLFIVFTGDSTSLYSMMKFTVNVPGAFIGKDAFIVIDFVLGSKISGHRVPCLRIPGLSVSGSQVAGPGSQVLILKYAVLNFADIQSSWFFTCFVILHWMVMFDRIVTSRGTSHWIWCGNHVKYCHGIIRISSSKQIVDDTTIWKQWKPITWTVCMAFKIPTLICLTSSVPLMQRIKLYRLPPPLFHKDSENFQNVSSCFFLPNLQLA